MNHIVAYVSWMENHTHSNFYGSSATLCTPVNECSSHFSFIPGQRFHAIAATCTMKLNIIGFEEKLFNCCSSSHETFILVFLYYKLYFCWYQYFLTKPYNYKNYWSVSVWLDAFLKEIITIFPALVCSSRRLFLQNWRTASTVLTFSLLFSAL